MKRLITSILVAAMAFASHTAMADNISLEQAKDAAAHYLAHNTVYTDLTANDLTLVHQIINPDLDIPAVYFFNTNKESAWIIFAASTVIDPVIAYSGESGLDMDNLAPAMRWWVDNYAKVVSDVQKLDAENKYPDSEQWIMLQKHALKGSTKGDGDHKWMNEKWDQGDENNPTYNLLCPELDGQTCIVGCGATAMSQICHYYQYPKQPVGTQSYAWNGRFLKLSFDTVHFDYSKMPDKLTSSSTEDEVYQVALLSWATGMAMRMDYGTAEGSGVNPRAIPLGMAQYYKYTEGTFTLRNGDGEDTAFIGKIRRQLIKKDVLCMGGSQPGGTGRDASGHAWVVCGYKESNEKEYYMNWGWGGPRTGDGWYNLADNNLRVSGSGYYFYANQNVVVGQTPPEDSNIHHSHIGICPVENSSVLGSAYPNPASMSVVLPYQTSEISELCVYSIDGKLVESRKVAAGNGSVTLKVDQMPAGIYIYRLNNATGKFVVK